MRILVIANGYPDRQSPQWGCFEKDQALALKKMGHDVTIMYVDRRFRTYWRKIGITKKKTEQGIYVYGMFYLPMGWLRDKVSYKLHQKIIMWLFDKLYQVYIKEQDKPDVIYAHFIWNISYASVLKRKYGIPLVGLEHWSELNNEHLSLIAKYWGRLGYQNSDKLLVVSQSLQEQIRKHFFLDTTIVYNMVGEEFMNLPPSPKRNDGIIRLVSTGSLIPRKGFDVLIKALSIIGEVKTSWEVLIIGEGTEHDNLVEQINSFHLENNVKLVGRKNKKEIIEILHRSDAFVLASRAENFSVAVLEALSAGLPVIATICGGIRECIHKENGLLVPVDDVSSLANALTKMINENSGFNRELIAEECRRRFSPHVIAGQLTEIFNEVTK